MYLSVLFTRRNRRNNQHNRVPRLVAHFSSLSVTPSIRLDEKFYRSIYDLRQFRCPHCSELKKKQSIKRSPVKFYVLVYKQTRTFYVIVFLCNQQTEPSNLFKGSAIYLHEMSFSEKAQFDIAKPYLENSSCRIPFRIVKCTSINYKSMTLKINKVDRNLIKNIYISFQSSKI